MQPTSQPRLDCAKHLAQRVLGIAFDLGLGWLVLPEVDCGQGFSFRRRARLWLAGSYRLVGSG
jgi:hypothetical protein